MIKILHVIFEILFCGVLFNHWNCCVLEKGIINHRKIRKIWFPSLLLYLCNVLSRKNICHACPVENIMRCSSSAFNGWFLLFLLESKICIKQACDNFCTVIICCVEHRKIFPLLFDTFHSTKYFHVHNHAIACYFCVG